jgi:hypothetical protein
MLRSLVEWLARYDHLTCPIPSPRYPTRTLCMGIKRPSRSGWLSSIVPEEIISPEGLPCLSRDHYLAILIIHLSIIFCPFPQSQPSRGISHPAQEKKNSFPTGQPPPADPRGRGVLVPYTGGENPTDALAENFPRTPPVGQSHISAHKSIHRKISENLEKWPLTPAAERRII